MINRLTLLYKKNSNLSKMRAFKITLHPLTLLTNKQTYVRKDGHLSKICIIFLNLLMSKIKKKNNNLSRAGLEVYKTLNMALSFGYSGPTKKDFTLC